MNSYFGIGIDAKITLDFHMKREEHPEKCRSRARNYMWYGVLGSKEWLQVNINFRFKDLFKITNRFRTENVQEPGTESFTGM
jgi:hypothetical protein